MDVLHLYSGNLFGGIERMLLTVAETGAGTHRFVLAFEGELSRRLRAAGARCDVVGPVRLSRPWTAWAARRRLRALLRGARPDAAITHSSWPHAVFAPVLREAGVPTFFYLHDLLRTLHWVDVLAARTLPAGVIANSEVTAETAGRLFPVPPVVIRCPVPPARPRVERAEVRAEMGTPAHTLVVVVAARLAPWKGHRLLLEALAHVDPASYWECWVVGGPQVEAERRYEAELRAVAAPLGGRVRFLGQRSDVDALLAAADIHCQPNLDVEPFGVAFAEALRAGLPVVTTAHGMRSGAVPPAAALVAGATPREVGEALSRLVLDAALRARLGAEGPPHVARTCGAARQVTALETYLGERLAGGAT